MKQNTISFTQKGYKLMIDTVQQEPYLDRGAKSVEERTIVIKPRTGKAVGLGVYKAGGPNPEFEVVYSPDIHDDIGISQEKLDIPGKSLYMLLYQFYNFSEKTCKITMHHRSTTALQS